MFKRINVKEDVVIKIDLYRNRREKVCEIPLDYVGKITYKFTDVDEIEITVPKYVYVNAEKKVNHVYNKINTRNQLVVTTVSKDGSEKKQRFTLFDRKMIGAKNSGSKSFTAYSWEKTLEKNRITVEQLSRQLTNKNDNVHVGEGILDLIAKKSGWTVGYVDPKARTTVSTVVESFNLELHKNLTIGNVAENGLIFESKVNIPASANKPLCVTMHYTDAITYSNTVNMVGNMNIINNMTSEPFHTGITKIQAYHYSDTGNRYGIRYVFTLQGGITTERIATFTNCVGKKLTISKVALEYDYGDLVEKENIRYATFEAFDDSALKFLKDVEEVFECVFKYDTMNNVIDVYARESLVNNKGYLLSVGHNVIDVDIQEDTDIITALKVESDNNVSIASENPNGTSIIENFSYYIKNNMISSELESALARYEVLIAKKQEEWNVLRESRSVCQQKYTKAASEGKSLEERIKNLTYLLTDCISSSVSEDGTQNPAIAELQKNYQAEIAALEVQYTKVVAEMATYTKELGVIDDKMVVIGNEIKKENATDNQGKIFTKEDLQEILDMTEVLTYTDSYYTTSYGLYNYAVKYLEERVKPTITFSLNCENLCEMIRNINGWDYILEMGSLFNLEKHDIFDDIEEKEVRLSEMTLVPIKNTDKVKAESFTFVNKLYNVGSLKVGANIGKTTNKTSGVVSNFKTLWEDSKTTNNFVGEMITSGLNIAAANIKGGVYRNILDFSEAGCFIINNDNGNTDKQIYIGGGTIAITNDAWATSEVAIDENGVLANTLFGKVILGEKLIITGDDGLFYIGQGKDKGEFGLYIYDGTAGAVAGTERVFLGLAMENGVKKAKLVLKNAAGTEVVLSEDGILQANQFVLADNVDARHPMMIPFRSLSGTHSYKEVILTLDFYPYRAFETGAAGGGGYAGASTVTSSSGGGVAYGSASGGGGSYSEAKTSGMQDWIVGDWAYVYTDEDYTTPDIQPGKHVHKVLSGSFQHNHSFNITLPNHTHKYTVDVPAHTHNVDMSVNVPSHTHNLVYGIYEDATPTNATVLVNGVVVGNVTGTGNSINIARHIKIGQMNEIAIRTSGNGRIVANVAAKFWQQW